MSQQNKSIVEKVNAAFAENDPETFLSFCADDVRWTMYGEKSVEGKDAIRKWMKEMEGMEPPKFTVTTLVAEGDTVVASGDMTMRDKDEKTAPYTYCDIYRFAGGKIAELNSFVVKTEPKAEGGRKATA
jgi:uncharacterized protein (TIGR02246 family)